MRTASLGHVLRGQRARRQTLEDVKLGRGHDSAGQHDAEPALKDPRGKETGVESYAFKEVVGNHTKFHWILPWKSRGRNGFARSRKAVTLGRLDSTCPNKN